MAASHSRTTDSIAGDRCRCSRTCPPDKPPRVGYRIGGDSEPCRQAPVPGALFDVSERLDRFQISLARRRAVSARTARARVRRPGTARALDCQEPMQRNTRRGRSARHRSVVRGRSVQGRDTPSPRAPVRQRGRVETDRARLQRACARPQHVLGQHQPAEPEPGITGPPEIAAPFECGDRSSQCALGCRMTPARQQPLHLDDRSVPCEDPVRASVFRTPLVLPLRSRRDFPRWRASREHAELPHTKLTQTQHCQRRARRRVTPVQHDDGTACERGRHIVGMRRVIEKRKIARHESTLPKARAHPEAPRHGESATMTGARVRATRRRRRCLRTGGCRLPRPSAHAPRTDACVPMKPKSRSSTLGVCARARLGPALLFDARAGTRRCEGARARRWQDRARRQTLPALRSGAATQETDHQSM